MSQDLAPTDTASPRAYFRPGLVVEIAAIRYPRGSTTFCTLYGPSLRQVIEAVERETGQEAHGLVVAPLIAAVVEDGEPRQRVVSVELRQDVDIGRGPLVAVINGGISARAIREAIEAIRKERPRHDH